MNLNNALIYKPNLFSDTNKDFVKSLFSPDKAITEEEKSLIETILDNSDDIFSLFTFDKASIRDRLYTNLFKLNVSNAYLCQKYIDILINKVSTEYYKLSLLEASKINSVERVFGNIKQKLSSLELSSNSWKFSLVESFDADTYIDKKNTTIITGNGIGILPISEQVNILIKNISVGKNTTAVFGTTEDIDFTDNINDLKDGTQIVVFESIDVNCTVELDVDINSTIVNTVSVTTDFTVTAAVPLLKEIYTVFNNQKVSLIEDDIKLDQETNTIYFNPIQTSKLYIVFEQPNSLQNSYPEKKIISLKKLEVLLTSFESKGELNSLELDIPDKLYSSKAEINFLIANELLYSYKFQFSLDNKLSWGDQTQILSTLHSDNLFYKLELSRNSEAFQYSNSIFQSDIVSEYFIQSEYINKFNSPSNIYLKNKPINNDICILQPKVFRKGGELRELQIGVGNNSEIKIPLLGELSPVEINKSTIRINGKIWTYIENISSASSTAEVWSIDKTNYKYIVFGNGTTGKVVPDKSIISLSLNLESLAFEKTKDSYITYFDNLFDPDKETIKITYVSLNSINKKIILKPGYSVHKLYPNIKSDSILISEKNLSGGEYSGTKIAVNEEVFNNGNYSLSTGEYAVDYINGYIYFAAETSNDSIITVSFDFYSTITLLNEDFSIIYEKSIPKGISIPIDSFPSMDVTDTVGNDLTILDIKGLNQVGARFTASTGDNRFHFTYKHPIKNTIDASNLFQDSTIQAKEIPHINGHDEFLGLILITNEYTSSFSGSGIKSFVIQHNDSFYSPLGISFNDNTYFIKEVFNVLTGANTVGDYYINPASGQIQVMADSRGIPAGIRLSYYFKDLTFDSTNKFSIDYKNGTLYSLSIFSSTGYIKYKAGNFYAGYDVASLISNFYFNSEDASIKLSTETINKNNIVKIIYPLSISSGISNLEKYFTPILKSITFRFN